MRWDVALVNKLKLTFVLGDASECVEARGSTTNIAPDKANVTLNLTESAEENGSNFCK